MLLVVAAGWTSAVPAAAGGGALLSFFRPAAGATQWVLWDARSGTQRVALSLPAMPSRVFWEADGASALYVLGRDVWRARLGEAAPVPERVAPLPDGAGEVRAVWIDRASRRLRAAAMLRVADGGVVTERGRVSYRAPDGALVPATRLPDWGLPYLCTVLEWSPDGAAWRTIARRATKDDAGDTPGLDVVDDLRHELGRSSERLLRAYTCENGQCRHDVPRRLVDAASAAAGRRLTNDDLSLWRAGRSKRAVVFGTTMGDTLHMTPPVLLAARDARSATPLPAGDRRQIGLGVDGDLLLLADEWTGARPVVADLRSGAIRLRVDDAQGAVWVPNFMRGPVGPP